MLCPFCSKEIPEDSRKCPHCLEEWDGGPDQSKTAKAEGGESGSRTPLLIFLAGFLVTLGWCSYLVNQDSGSSEWVAVDSRGSISTESSPGPDRRSGPKLELGDWSWSQSHRFAIVEGVVKNLSDKPLERVQAIAQFYAEDGTFITSDSALIEYNPIMPGQESPFKVMATWNPLMKRAKVEFKKMFGGKIESR